MRPRAPWNRAKPKWTITFQGRKTEVFFVAWMLGIVVLAGIGLAHLLWGV